MNALFSGYSFLKYYSTSGDEYFDYLQVKETLLISAVDSSCTIFPIIDLGIQRQISLISFLYQTKE